MKGNRKPVIKLLLHFLNGNIFAHISDGWKWFGRESGPLKVSFAQNVTHKYRNGNGIIASKLYATREFCVHSQVKNYNYWQKSF